MKLPLLKDISHLSNIRVLIRLDLNVSIYNGQIVEDFRIKKIVRTLEFLTSAGAKVIAISHIDEKEGGTLEPVAKYLVQFFPRLRFIRDIYSGLARSECDNLQAGGIILFENLRKWPGEEANDVEFSKHLSSFADIYINEAFSTSHRNHASIVGVPEYLPSYIGFVFEDEVRGLSHAIDPEHPFVFILGGAKFETKVPLLKKYLKNADNVFIGGAIANDFFKKMQYFMGDSLLSRGDLNLDEFIADKKIILPIDVRTQHKGFKYVKKPSQISVNEKIYDVGPETVSGLSKLIKEARLIVWNGPMGNIEAGATAGTLELAKLITSSKAMSIIGGGDTLRVINNTEFYSKFSFVSTGGGAMLSFLAEDTLPGIEAIKKNLNKISPKKTKSWFRRMFS